VPQRDRIGAVRRVTQTRREQPVFALQALERERVRVAERVDGCVAKCLHLVVHQHIAIAAQEAVLAAGRAPDQRAVVRVELLDAVRRLDHLGPRHREPRTVAHHDPVGAARDDAHAAEAAVRATDQHHDRNTGGAHVEHRAHHLADRDQAGIRLVQPYAAGFGEQQHRRRPVAQRALQQPDELGAMHLADTAAHELAFLRGDEDAAAIEPAVADHDAVVEGRRHAELRKVRAHHARARRQPLFEARRVEQPRDPLARRALGETRVHAAASFNPAAA
jgi:hypothetical protein